MEKILYYAAAIFSGSAMLFCLGCAVLLFIEGALFLAFIDILLSLVNAPFLMMALDNIKSTKLKS